MHRVIEPPSEGREIAGRYSIAFFGHLHADLVVQPLDACCSQERPARFPSVVAGEHVKARVKQLHVAGHSTKKENVFGAA
jgi:isopenicillin N synthase-like dioxygenase